MASRLTATTKFSGGNFSTPVIFKASPSFSAHGAAPMTKTYLLFPAFPSRFVDFAVQFCFRCIQRGATLESGLTVARFFSTNHNSLLRIATNKIASFCVDHRSRQIAFFRAKAGQRRGKTAGFRVMLKYF